MSTDMQTGFVLITTKPLKEKDVFNALNKKNQQDKKIEYVQPLLGEYDILVKVNVKNFDALGKFVVDEIMSIPDIEDTKTLHGIKYK